MVHTYSHVFFFYNENLSRVQKVRAFFNTSHVYARRRRRKRGVVLGRRNARTNAKKKKKKKKKKKRGAEEEEEESSDERTTTTTTKRRRRRRRRDDDEEDDEKHHRFPVGVRETQTNAQNGMDEIPGNKVRGIRGGALVSDRTDGVRVWHARREDRR